LIVPRPRSDASLRTVNKARHCKKFQRLHKAQHPPFSHDNRKTLVNLSEVPLEEASCSALRKGLNYAVTPTVVPVEDFLCVVDKALDALPEDTAEKVRQETIRILNSSRRPKDKLTIAERNVLRAFKANEAITILSAHKGNAIVVLETADFNPKIAALLDDHSYKKLMKDSTESVERKTVLLRKIILTFLGSMSTTSAVVFQAPETPWVAEDLQARGFPWDLL
jgi:hypothetical protein